MSDTTPPRAPVLHLAAHRVAVFNGHHHPAATAQHSARSTPAYGAGVTSTAAPASADERHRAELYLQATLLTQRWQKHVESAHAMGMAAGARYADRRQFWHGALFGAALGALLAVIVQHAGWGW